MVCNALRGYKAGSMEIEGLERLIGVLPQFADQESQYQFEHIGSIFIVCLLLLDFLELQRANVLD